MKKKKKNNTVPKLRQEVKVKVDIVTSDDIKIYYTEGFQDFTARYTMNRIPWLLELLLRVSYAPYNIQPH